MTTISKIVTIAGIICGAFGIHMLYKGTTVIISTVSFSAGLVLLIIASILIVAAFYSYVGPWLRRNWLALSAIILIGLYLKDPLKLETADKYEILVQLIIILFALVGATGYGIFKWISRGVADQVEKDRQQIEDRVTTITDEIRKKAKDDRNIMRARVETSSGYVWYEHHNIGVKHERDAKAGSNSPDYIALAISHGELALKDANKLNEKDHEELICRCKSNLAYYLAERHRKKRHPTDKERALELARNAYQVAQEKRALEYVRPYNWEETYAWVLWQFADNDEAAKQKAREIINGLRGRIELPDPWRETIEKKLAPLLTPNNTKSL